MRPLGAKRVFSYRTSARQKPGLGCTCARTALTPSKAFRSEMRSSDMSTASTTVPERETPYSQWTRQTPPRSRAFRTKPSASSKLGRISCDGWSVSRSRQQEMPASAYEASGGSNFSSAQRLSTCVTPMLRSSQKLTALYALPR